MKPQFKTLPPVLLVKKKRRLYMTEYDNINLRIGLYLQTDDYKNSTSFDDMLDTVSDEKLDIIVFPEFSFPFNDYFLNKDIMTADLERVFEKCLEFSSLINKAVIINFRDVNGFICSVYANHNATGDETRTRLFIKHTMTEKSAFDLSAYDKKFTDFFTPVNIRGYSIGVNVSFDCGHAVFSRIYGLQNVDLIISSTSEDETYKRGYLYTKTRAIENNCFNLADICGEKAGRSFTCGFNPEGGLISPVNTDEKRPSTPGMIYIYNLSDCNMKPDKDEYINQRKFPSEYSDIDIRIKKSFKLLLYSEKIDNNLYVFESGYFNLVIAVVSGDNILEPEYVLPLLYNKKLSKYKNKRYLVINKHEGHVDEKFFEEKLSAVLKTRAVENRCLVLIESDNINNCYQVTSARHPQVLKENDNGTWSVDVKRIRGPEIIWFNKKGMKKKWRKNFENLIEYIHGFADENEFNHSIADESYLNDIYETIYSNKDTISFDEIDFVEEYKDKIIEEFFYDALSDNSRKLLEESHGFGKIIYTIILKTGESLKHQYVYAGTEVTDDDKVILGKPYRIPEENITNIKDEDIFTSDLTFIPDDIETEFSNSIVNDADFNAVSKVNDVAGDYNITEDDLNLIRTHVDKKLEVFNYNPLTNESKELLKKSKGHGKIIYRIILKNDEILNYQYVYAGTKEIEGNKVILAIPHKIPENSGNIKEKDILNRVLMFIPDENPEI